MLTAYGFPSNWSKQIEFSTIQADLGESSMWTALLVFRPSCPRLALVGLAHLAVETLNYSLVFPLLLSLFQLLSLSYVVVPSAFIIFPICVMLHHYALVTDCEIWCKTNQYSTLLGTVFLQLFAERLTVAEEKIIRERSGLCRQRSTSRNWNFDYNQL